jgi:hypothetical protein
VPVVMAAVAGTRQMASAEMGGAEAIPPPAREDSAAMPEDRQLVSGAKEARAGLPETTTAGSEGKADPERNRATAATAEPRPMAAAASAGLAEPPMAVPKAEQAAKAERPKTASAVSAARGALPLGVSAELAAGAVIRLPESVASEAPEEPARAVAEEMAGMAGMAAIHHKAKADPAEMVAVPWELRVLAEPEPTAEMAPRVGTARPCRARIREEASVKAMGNEVSIPSVCPCDQMLL